MQDIAQRIYALEGRIFELEEELNQLRAKLSGEVITDFTLTDRDGGSIRLSTLFGPRDQMLLIHNMGFDCPYCTMWADGFNAVYDHIAAKAAFVLSSPDAFDRQQSEATARSWRFPMVSTRESSIARDLGFERDGKPLPGVSALVKAPDARSHAQAWPHLGRAIASARFGTCWICCQGHSKSRWTRPQRHPRTTQL